MPVLLATDDFNRSGALGANWTVDAGGFNCDGSKVAATSGPGIFNRARYTAISPPNDVLVKSKLHGTVGGSSWYQGVMARAPSGNYGYAAYWVRHVSGNPASDQFVLKSFSGGDIQAITNPGIAVGDEISLECIGTAIKAYHNGVLKLSGTNSDYSSGGVGLMGVDTTKIWDDFEVWDATRVESDALVPTASHLVVSQDVSPAAQSLIQLYVDALIPSESVLAVETPTEVGAVIPVQGMLLNYVESPVEAPIQASGLLHASSLIPIEALLLVSSITVDALIAIQSRLVMREDAVIPAAGLIDEEWLKEAGIVDDWVKEPTEAL